jgi:hypothetical protein
MSPVGRSIVQENRPAPRLTALDGRAIALMDNMKSNADVLLERIGANLRASYRDLEVKRFRKPTTSAHPFDAATLDTVRQHYDAAIAAVGD